MIPIFDATPIGAHSHEVPPPSKHHGRCEECGEVGELISNDAGWRVCGRCAGAPIVEPAPEDRPTVPIPRDLTSRQIVWGER